MKCHEEPVRLLRRSLRNFADLMCPCASTLPGISQVETAPLSFWRAMSFATESRQLTIRLIGRIRRSTLYKESPEITLSAIKSCSCSGKCVCFSSPRASSMTSFPGLSLLEGLLLAGRLLKSRTCCHKELIVFCLVVTCDPLSVSLAHTFS